MTFDLSRLAQQMVGLIQSSAEENDQRVDLTGMVRLRVRVHPRLSPPAELDDSAVYLQFFCMAFEFAVSPHAARRPQAGALSLRFEIPPWKWAAQPARNDLPGMQASSVK